MAKSTEPTLLKRDFTFTTDAELNSLIAAHRAAHEAEHGKILAMHARQSLGSTKVRITFRVVEKKGGR
ncbi:MAG: hypothetical protein IV100_32355 [Myxococcales bacterium]|nr:hypothetical protein [Myxococcales bacterium]